MHTQLSYSVNAPSYTPVHRSYRETTSDTDEATKPYLRLPVLWSSGHRFYCDGKELAFTRARHRITLLRAFLAARNHQLNRPQIITLVYGESQLHRRSPRYVECLHMNVLRMLSDTRRQLYLAYAALHPGVDWLYFNKSEKKWKLVRFRDDYVLTQLSARIFYPAPQYVPVTSGSGWY